MTDSGSEPSGHEELARRAVDAILGFLERATSLARAVLIFSFVACALGYVLGILALDGGLRTFWIVAAGLVALFAVGSVIAALRRLGTARRRGDAMVTEVRTLMGDDAGLHRTVIDTVEVSESSQGDGVVQLSRHFAPLRETVVARGSDTAELSGALASVVALPGAMALATVVGFGFAGLSLLFALVLVF